jgi:2-iminobutanoate/2-iminopropanoate deaminase
MCLISQHYIHELPGRQNRTLDQCERNVRPVGKRAAFGTLFRAARWRASLPGAIKSQQQETAMRREINPETFPKPQSNYSQGVVHGPVKERLVISGQVGVRPDGSVADGLEAQMAQTWENFLAVLGSAGFQTADVVKVTVYVTELGLQEFRRGREAALAGYAPAATYVEVAGLADPRFLVEIEGEAVKT